MTMVGVFRDPGHPIMKQKIIIEAEGDTQEDFVRARNWALDKIMSGLVKGAGADDASSFSFTVETVEE